jgi:hypothetical protein
MKTSMAMVYLTIILAALLAFTLFDRNVSNQEAKAGQSLRISRINTLIAECGQNIRLCERAQEKKVSAEISVRAFKSFMKHFGEEAQFGTEASKMWSAFSDEAAKMGLSVASNDSIVVKNSDIEEIKNMNLNLKNLMEQTAVNDYNFEF